MDKLTQSLLGSALGYAAGGWKVFPLRLDGKKPLPNCPVCQEYLADGTRIPRTHLPKDCPCIPKGRPCHGPYAATGDPERIHRWWTKPYGIAVACGPSGLIVLDCDDHGGKVPDNPVPSRPGRMMLTPRTGMDVMMMLAYENDYDLFASTAVTVTPGGGRQLLFSAKDAMDFKQDSNGALAWQVDVKAGMIQTTLAPTLRPDGAYRWKDPDVPVAPLPDWIRGMLMDSGLHLPTEEAKKPPPSIGGGAKVMDRATVTKVFSRQMNQIRACPNGVTWQLSKSAYVLGRVVARNGATYDDAFGKLFRVAQETVAANGKRPFDEYKVRTVIEEGLGDGMESVHAEEDAGTETQVT